jgi:outer membrane protein assembly factor BamD (BamD/ComL family)
MKLLIPILFALCFCTHPAFAGDEEREEAFSGSPKWWWAISGPSEKNPEDQYKLAQERIEAGKVKKGITTLEYLVQFWPESPLAPKAQLEVAEKYESLEKWRKAFEAYQHLVTRYAGQFNYEKAIESQYEIARKMEDTRIGDVLFLPGFAAPEEAIPFYTQIVTNAPQWEMSSTCLHRVGELYQETGKHRQAIATFEQVLSQYPTSANAELSSYEKAHSLTLIAKGRPNDDTSAEQAWAALTLFLEQYKSLDQKRTDEAFELLNTIRQRLAASAWKKARYYDETKTNPKAALISYRALVEEFPDSEWTASAKSRIETLSLELEQP